MLPIKYDSITQDGYIEIHGIPNSTHRTKDDIFEAYGENFEHLSGDVVTDEDDHQEILLKIDTEDNLKLSEERAEEVDKYLTKNGDIDHLSIQTNGYGEEEPIESNAEEEGRERNRRVEIVIENLE